MNNKTIIYSGGFVLPDKNAAANRVVSNGKIFASLGCKTVFLGLSDDRFDGIRTVDKTENMFEQARPVSTKQWVKRLFCIDEICSLAEKYNADTVILYNLPFFTLCIAKKFFSKRDIDVVYDCTEWTKDTDGSFVKKAFKVLDEFLIRNFAHKIADRMIAISSVMQKKYSKSKKLLVLPPLVDINDEIWHQKPPKNEGVFEFCFAGVPDGNKESLDRAVQAFCKIKNNSVRFRVIGITEEEFFSIYPNAKIPDSAKNRIVFMGRLSHAETIKYVLGCDCYIFIRQSDSRNNAGFPTKFAEAYTCAVPVITTDVSDVGRYIRNSGRGEVLRDMSCTEIEKAMLSAVRKGKKSSCEPDSVFHYGSYISETKNWLE